METTRRRYPFRAFNGGELTPGLYSRAELAPFQTGVAVCRNFQVLPHGALENRQGTRYVLETKDSSKVSRLIDFEYSAEQTIMLELGDQYMRFHDDAGTVLEAEVAITAITQADPGVFTSVAHGLSADEWVYISAVVGMTEINGRFFIVNTVPTADTFTLKELDGTVLYTSALTAYTSGGTFERVYEIATPFLEADLFDIHYAQDADLMTFTHPDYTSQELVRTAATNWSISAESFTPTATAPLGLGVVGTGGDTAVTHYYKVTTLLEDTLEESVATTAVSVANDLTFRGAKNTLTWNTVTGAERYKIYSTSNDGVYGYIGETEDNGGGTETFIDRNILPDTTRTPPIARDPFSGADNYPGTVAYFDQRKVYGGTTNDPQSLFATRIGIDNNFHYSIPSRDDDSIIVKLKAQKIQQIRHLMPLDDLIVLTSSGVFKIDSAASDSVMTPTTIRSKTSEHIGAANTQPVLTKSSGFYVQALGSTVREVKYEFTNNGYTSIDHSILAEHLFKSYTIADMAYSRGPEPIIWAVRSDGTLLGETVVPEHEVKGWHRHDTVGGEFESVAVKQEGNEDVPYFIVKRTIDGRDVRYIETFASRQFDDLEDGFFVDCGLTYDGASTTSITNLNHLEGQTVAVLGDGAVLPQQVVTDGAITLPVAVEKAQIGLPITAQIQTLPLVYAQDLSNFGGMVNINRVFLRVISSSGVKVGPKLTKLRERKPRSDEVYGTPPDTVTGIIHTRIDGDWDEEGQIWIQHDSPLPLTVAAMLLEPATSD